MKDLLTVKGRGTLRLPSALERRFRPRPEDLPTGCAGDHRDYRRFVVLSTSRSGSSFLVQSLRSHSRLICFGEVFQPGEIHFNTPGFSNRNRRLRRWRDRHVVDFLDEVIYRGYEKHMRAVGFKILYEDLDRRRLASIIGHLGDMRGLRVIHLRRENLLRAYLSFSIATHTGRWFLHDPELRYERPIRLEPRHCRKYFERVSSRAEVYDRLLQGEHKLDVVYETLVTEESEFLRVQRFLGVEPETLSTKLIKLEVRPLRQAIENYESLKAEFDGTRWSHFFDE